MRLFTVHVPLLAGSGRPAYERAVFVRDGFSVFAFLCNLLWCLWRGLWLAALGVLVIGCGLFALGRALHLSAGAQLGLQVVLALLVGLEASNLRRFSLRRRGYVDAGTVATDRLDDAETIFFTNVADEMGGPSRRAGADAGPDGPGGRRRVQDIVGLFPEFHGR